MRSRPRGAAILAGVLWAGAASASAPDVRVPATGFLVVAPDRGFLGNEELRDAYDAFAKGRNAALAFVTDERTRGSFDAALATLRRGGAERVLVLPFFLSRSDPRFQLAQGLLPAAGQPAVAWARPYGESYFAVESLAERLRAVENRAGRRVLVVGAGARDAESRQRMAADGQRLASLAAAGLGFESVRAVVETSGAELGKGLEAAAAVAPSPLVVPFHLGSKLDGMMSYTGTVRRAARGLEVLEADVTPSPAIPLWLAREANRALPAAPGEVGVMALAHGGDHHWNESMREALAPLQERYLVEPAFSMADPVVIGRALRRLEARGARTIVVLRAYALRDSFRQDVERLIGLDVEDAAADEHAVHAAHGSHGGHGGHDAAPPARLLSAAVLTTVGGMEDHRFFAEALLERARKLSRDPSRETVILAAHGDGDDARDAHWRGLLDSLAAQMRRGPGGDEFRSIVGSTWREDWPDKRPAAVERLRGLVEQAGRDGGRALVVPARIAGRGPERELLQGLSFEWGEGFAPHPLFGRWAEEQVARSLEALAASR